MTPLESEFDLIFKNKGGRYINRNSDIQDIAWSLASSRILIAWIRRTEAHLPEPYIDIIDNIEPNAFATKSGSKYFIGITYGAIVIFQDIFYRMYSSKIFLADVGEQVKEVDADEKFFLRLTHMAQFALPDDPPTKSSPINDIRFFLSFQIMKMAFEFLVWHEFAHIIYGHLGFVHSVLGSFEIREMKREKETRKWIDPLISQTLEVKADSYAAIRGMDILEILISNPGMLSPGLRPYFNDWSVALKMWVFATYTFFRLFSNQNIATGMKKASHPPPSVRSHLVLAVAISALDGRNNVPPSRILSKLCVTAAAEIEMVFGEISQNVPDFTHLIFSTQDEISEHALFLGKHWNNVMPLLQPFTFSPLPE